ncbi:hypothetical protein J2W56_006382 [Nocardia kruczakiae]|uniref:Mce-associated membrane protein n=1 Tax=Nocardia kruczakiae TaxID=261477 RepID=A0ABU1XRM8_9NOCA|nr:hypothetical protein [Nocardia kruczakiae]MDR7172617.1 hypothetical protein [Nocardia kruczakiae]
MPEEKNATGPDDGAEAAGEITAQQPSAEDGDAEAGAGDSSASRNRTGDTAASRDEASAPVEKVAAERNSPSGKAGERTLKGEATRHPHLLGRRPDRTVLSTGLGVLATVAALTFGVLWASDDSGAQLASLRGRQQIDSSAEDFATHYALAVSKVDHTDIEAWRRALDTGVTDALKVKMDAAVNVVGPLLTEMQYTSTAKPLAAKVSQRDDDRYVVQVFVDMNSRSRQTPDGVAATASYTVTLRRSGNWTITDVGGVGAGLPGGDTPAPAPAPGR